MVITVSVLIFVAFFLWRASFDKIYYILKNGPQLNNQSVRITGIVKDSISIPFVGNIYRISYGTEQIWIISRNDSSVEGVVSVGGIVKNGIDSILKSDLLPPAVEPIKAYIKTDTPFIIEDSREGLVQSFRFTFAKRQIR